MTKIETWIDEDGIEHTTIERTFFEVVRDVFSSPSAQEDQRRESPAPEPPGRQRGFFQSPDGSQFRLRPQPGDRMIRRKEKKRKRKSPFGEVTDYERWEREVADGFGRHVTETSHGGVRIDEVGHSIKTSTVGEPGGWKTTYQGPGRPPQPEMSDAAWRLYWKRRAAERKARSRSQAADGGEPAGSPGRWNYRDAVGPWPGEKVNEPMLLRMIALAREILAKKKIE